MITFESWVAEFDNEMVGEAVKETKSRGEGLYRKETVAIFVSM